MRFLLLPISFFYHIALSIRHKLYDWHVLRSKGFEQPVICVGNLALGGTGKTPHVEYLIYLLKEHYRVCVVSRGYGRKTKGFQLANTSCGFETIGDEPIQYVNKFNDLMVAVDESRNRAIELMNTIDRPPEVYLLDDAFQHRSTRAGLNILLTAYDKLYCDDFLVPAGTLRDIRSAARRANIIIVSKTPNDIDDAHKAKVIGKLDPLPYQKVYFSSLEYDYPDPAEAVLLFCGIARPEPLVEELRCRYPRVDVMAFPDHHPYTEKDIDNILRRYQNMDGERKIMVTTEKDLARLTNSPYLCQFESVPLFTMPVRIIINEKEKFNEEILSYVRKNAHYG